MPSSFKNDLLNFLRPDQLSESDSAKVCYSTDASRIEGRVLGVIWPESTEEVSKVVKLAKEYKVPIVARGGGTGLVGGCVPLDAAVVDLSKMRGVYGVMVMGGGDKKVFNCIVDAGVTIGELNKRLEKEGLQFPVIPSSYKVCTIGGAIATNAAGNRAIKYGKVCRWIEEVDFVDGNGEIKKISGDELTKEICGSEGLFGIITKARLRLTKLPEKTSMDVFEFSSIDEMIGKLAELRRDDVLSIEFINEKAGELVGLKDTIFVEYIGENGQLKGKELEEMWKKREGIYALAASNGFPLISDPQLPDQKIHIFLNWVDNKQLPAFGHIGLGIIHVLAPENNYPLLDEIIKMSIELGGSVTGEHGIGIVKKEFISAERKGQIKELKKKYDPDEIMNRGKI